MKFGTINYDGKIVVGRTSNNQKIWTWNNGTTVEYNVGSTVGCPEIAPTSNIIYTSVSGNLYKSTNSGTSFNFVRSIDSQLSFNNGGSMHVSNTGEYFIMENMDNRKIGVFSDYGNSYNLITYTGSTRTTTSCSSSEKYMCYSVGNDVYVSTDYGTTFNQISLPVGFTTVGNCTITCIEDVYGSYTECTDARTYLTIPYSSNDWRFKVKFAYVKRAGNPNDVVISVGSGGVNFNRQGEYTNKVKCIYYSSGTLIQYVQPSAFNLVQYGKVYDVEFSHLNNVLTCYIDGKFIYSYSDSRYYSPSRPIYLFNDITGEDGSYSRIYEAQVYSSNSDSSIVYNLIPYEDPVTHYGGFKDTISRNVYTASGLITK